MFFTPFLPLAEISGHHWNLPLLVSLLLPVLALFAYPLLARQLMRLSTLPPAEEVTLRAAIPDLPSSMARRLRLWHTRFTVCNAAVIGFLPGFSYLLISDALWNRLSPRAIAAIVAHEMGHLRLWHLPLRLSVVLAGGMLGLVLVREMEDVPQAKLLIELAVVSASGLYMALMLRFVAPLTEFEADAFALDSMSKTEENRKECGRELVRALWQLSSYSGLHPDQRTWLYPSFEQRRKAILCLQKSPNLRHWLRITLLLILCSQVVIILQCLVFLLF